MSQFSSSFQTAAGSSTLPIASIYAIAGTSPTIRQIGVFNTTAVAVALRLMRLTTTGTQGAGQTEAEWDEDGSPPLATVFTTHTVLPTLGNEMRRAQLGAAIGSGVIWTFGGKGLIVPVGTTSGIGLVPVGTGQICDFYIDWEE